IGKQIIVKTLRDQSFLNPEQDLKNASPQATITGTIADATGQPLPGVNVLVEGTTTGTQSDFDGNYAIQASEDAILIYSYLGMLTQRIPVDGRSMINVTLREDVASLDE